MGIHGQCLIYPVCQGLNLNLHSQIRCLYNISIHFTITLRPDQGRILGDKNLKSFSRTALHWRILKIDMGVLHVCLEQSNSLSTCSRPTESSNQKISFWADWLMGFPSNVLAMSKLVLAFLKVRDVESTFWNCMECNLELADFSWSISWKA